MSSLQSHCFVVVTQMAMATTSTNANGGGWLLDAEKKNGGVLG